MKTVGHLLQKKGHEVWSVTPDTSVFDSIKLMADKQIGALMVIGNDTIMGIVTERDYLRKVALHGHSSKEMRVSEIMTERLLYVSPDQTIDECMALMTDKYLRHLPVIDGDRLVGVVSMRDVIKEVIADKEFLIDQLETYISGQHVWQGAQVVSE